MNYFGNSVKGFEFSLTLLRVFFKVKFHTKIYLRFYLIKIKSVSTNYTCLFFAIIVYERFANIRISNWFKLKIHIYLSKFFSNFNDTWMIAPIFYYVSNNILIVNCERT